MSVTKTCCAWLLCLIATTTSAASSNSILAVSRDGRLLATANHDNGTVSIVDIGDLKVLYETAVGTKPEGVTFVGATHTLATTVYGDDKIVLIDADTGAVTGEINVFDEPYGIVANQAGTKLYVTLEYPGDVVEIDVATRKIVRSLPAGAFLRGLALAADERRLYVTEYLTGAALALDLQTGAVDDRWQGSASENLARQIALHPVRPKAYVPHIRSRTNVNQGEGSIVPFISVIDTSAGEGKRRQPLPMDAFNRLFVVANPWEAAVSPDGRTLCALFAGTDDMYVCRILDDNYRELRYVKTVKLGHNPRAVVYAPDGDTVFVYNTLDFEVVAFDAKTFEQKSVIGVCQNPLGEEKLLGKILFYSALQPMVGRRWISCASCHPDGDADGRTWQNPEGLRNTTALYGMAWTHPIHWSADRDEVQDFEHTIRSRLMQGQGLIEGVVSDSLAEPNKGRSDRLDALAAYSNMHKAPISPHAKGGLNESARRGRTLFFAGQTRCAECHCGPYFSDSTPDRPYRLHDVGTGNDDPSETIGPVYDTPSLLAAYRTAPYLHHGKAQTLAEVLTTFNREDRHGKTSHLSAAEVADLVEFLKALPYEDPEPAARQQGLVKIER